MEDPINVDEVLQILSARYRSVKLIETEGQQRIEVGGVMRLSLEEAAELSAAPFPPEESGG